MVVSSKLALRDLDLRHDEVHEVTTETMRLYHLESLLMCRYQLTASFALNLTKEQYFAAMIRFIRREQHTSHI